MAVAGKRGLGRGEVCIGLRAPPREPEVVVVAARLPTRSTNAHSPQPAASPSMQGAEFE